MKKVYRALKLRHHKHTGKLLAHKHTSYRVLFLLMLMPIAMLLLVNQMEAWATDYTVTATVPAPLPPGAPEITTPANGTTIHSSGLTVSGTCPVVNPAIIVALYDGNSLIGSVACESSGTYSLPVSLSYGTHTLVATVVNFTGQTGASSSPVTVYFPVPPMPSRTPTPSPVAGVSSPSPKPTPVTALSEGASASLPTAITNEPVILISPNGHATWHGSFTGGLLPYVVYINWGDGTIDKHIVIGATAQTYSHVYKTSGYEFAIVVKMIDARGVTTIYESAAVTTAPRQGAAQSTVPTDTPSLLAFVQKYIWQIYIITFFSLIFLWYLEHGRHAGHLSRFVGRLFGKWPAHRR